MAPKKAAPDVGFKWTQIADMNHARMKHSLFSNSIGMFIFGGYNYDDGIVSDIEYLS